ncbi:glycosyltransferase family 39 protein [Candidatus Daviesbacteria bacterium]|nr:glycosyltransferase family 39 protein [Candidatus Daviesbacteria bacterium]MBI2334793.1 glycosyltransferase family 39 protein [Candidatus Daviesbacteria bacterium]
MSKVAVLLFFIVILSLGVRIINLSIVPPALSWDEAAVGYNGWTIANFGQDEYGNRFPLSFKSFGEYKNPVDIYLTALTVKFLGLSEFSTRLPAALFGVLNVILIFFLVKALFSSSRLGLAAAFFLSISPQNIHFSRFNHEANFALFFFMLGLVLFLATLKGKKLLFLALISFILSFLSYSASKMFIPLFIIILVLIYRKELLKIKVQLLCSGVLIALFAIFLFLHPHALGIERATQTVGKLNLAPLQYIRHFSIDFLFIHGDKNPRLSAQATGEFYYIDAVFLLAGFILIFRKRTKEFLLVAAWSFLAVLPASFSTEAPHAGRAAFMMGSWQIIAALGFYRFNKIIRWGSLGILIILLVNFLNLYFGQYSKRFAIEWQYGMKQIVEFIQANPQYNHIYMTDARYQPYIFFLYYLQTPLPDYLRTVTYNKAESSRSYNNVFFFDKYFFGGWDRVESVPDKGVLYILTPSEYDGLKYRSSFEVKKIIKYPNETDAFYLVTGQK